MRARRRKRQPTRHGTSLRVEGPCTLTDATRIAMVAPSLNPAHPGFRYRCDAPAAELRRRGWRVRTTTLPQLAAEPLVIAMSDVCLGAADDAAQALHTLAQCRRQGARLVVTESDHRLYNPLGNAELQRKAQAVRRLYELADEIVTTTEPLTAFMREVVPASTPITIVPDALERPQALQPRGLLRRVASWRHRAPHRALQALRQGLQQQPPGSLRVVWFGGHGTGRGEEGGMLDLLTLQAALEAAHPQRPLSLTVISDNRAKFEQAIRPLRVPTFYLDWNRLTFHAALRLHHACVIPVRPSPWTVCKSNNRLVTALHAGLVCVADSIPSYEPFSVLALIGPCASHLTRALADIDRLRAQAPANVRAVEARWDITQVGNAWEALVRQNLARMHPTPARSAA